MQVTNEQESHIFEGILKVVEVFLSIEDSALQEN